MKTFEQCCEEVAKEYKYANWNEMLDHFIWREQKGFIENSYKKAAQLYREKGVKEAVKLARINNTCCQRVLGVVLEDNDAICCHNYIGYTEQEIIEKLKE